MIEPQHQALVLTGPTAAGKTAIALALAREVPLEVVSVDSALVYRGLDIGSAKPSQAERAAVPHHLIDIRNPDQPYSAAEFVRDARDCIASIAARGRLPLLVGGTPLYIKALTEGLDELPPAQPAVRAAISAQAAEQGWPALHAELARVDPLTAQRLSPQDSQRISRALEVYRATGQPLSALHTRQRHAAGRPQHARSIVAAMVSLEPRHRAWLHARIERRLQAMLDAGFLDEVRALRQLPGCSPDLPALRSVGYRQAWAALDAGLDDAAARQQVLTTATAATRQLAKRQLTWLRGMPARIVVACDDPDAHHSALARLRPLAAALLSRHLTATVTA